MQDQDEVAILKDILNGIGELIADTRGQRREVKLLHDELDQKHSAGKLTDLYYALSVESLRRNQQTIDYCLRSLDRQKKIALTKLYEIS
jgi:hypothetical protein